MRPLMMLWPQLSLWDLNLNGQLVLKLCIQISNVAQQHNVGGVSTSGRPEMRGSVVESFRLSTSLFNQSLPVSQPH